MSTLMSCGCVGAARHNNAHDGLEVGHPSCVTHIGREGACTPATVPNLAGRTARCACGATEPSNVELAFFEYRGPDSPASKRHCAQCGYYESAHKPTDGRPRFQQVCLRFRPHGPYKFDDYYCGHGGWD